MTLSTNFYGSSVNKGIGGLMSGLDTDELVKQMTAATRNKINRQYQAKQKLLYKQEAYREITSKLLTFSDKYFSFATGSKTNILSAGFFEAYTFKSSSSYVSVTGDADAISNFKINSISKVASAATASATVKDGISIDSVMNKPINEIAGLEGLSNHEITVNEKQIEIDVTKSMNDVMKKINSESDVNVVYSSTLGKLILTSKETGSESNVDISGDLVDALFETIDKKGGQDTEMNVNLYGENVDIVRSSANFSIDGINIELGKSAEGLNNITFEVENNSDEIAKRLKQFIDDYNEIITLIGDKTKEKPKNDYPPLTPEQQDDMEEKDIENWNKEAKKGMLFGDSNMLSLLSDLRSSLTGSTDVSELTLSSIGISSAYMDTSGKLVFDEEKFKKALMEKPDEIASLFTGTSENEGISGLAVQLKDILNENIGAFGTSGKLIDEAGLDSGRTSDQNNISLKIKDYDKKMETLKKNLEAERKRYWSQFTALEKALNNLNSQSEWLTNMLG